MKTEDEAIRIREVYLRTGSIQASARECGCAWRTAKAALSRDYSVDGGITHRHRQPNAWHDRIDALITQNLPDEEKCRKLRLTAKRIHDIIAAEGSTLSARQVQRMASRIRAALKSSHRDAAKMITDGVMGAWQVDFGEMDCYISGRRRRVHLLVLSGRFSNAAVYTVCESEQADALFDGLQRCFEQVGGVPPVLRFDNMAPVCCWTRGHNRRMTDAFSRFACHCGFTPELCNPRSGWEKGNVECKVKYVRQNFFVPVPDFASVEALNAALSEWSVRDMARKHYQKGAAIADLLTRERQTFLPMPDKPFEYWRQYATVTDRQGCIQFENNRYFASKEMGRAHVIVRVSTRKVSIYNASSMTVLATHARRYGRGGLSMPVERIAEMIAEKPSALPYCAHDMQDAGKVLEMVKALRVADRVGAITQILRGQKILPELASLTVHAGPDLTIYDNLAFGVYEQRKRDIEPVHKTEIRHGDSGHAAGTG